MTDKNNNKYSYIGFGISFGLIGGALTAVIINLFIETPLVWAFTPGFGMLIGIIIGAIIDHNKNKK